MTLSWYSQSASIPPINSNKADCFEQNPTILSPFPLHQLNSFSTFSRTSQKGRIIQISPSPSISPSPPMLPLKLVRSLVLGEPMTHHNHHSHGQDNDDDASSMATATTTRRRRRARTPLLVFTPTTEIIHNTYRLSSIARDIGMDLYPNSSLSHIIFSWPSPSPHFPPSSSASSSSSRPSFSSSTTTSSSTPLIHHYELPNGAVPLPFPTLTLASLSLLRYFVSISKGLFKLAFFDGDLRPELEIDDRFSSWDCSSLSLVSRGTGFRVESMDGFSRVLTGHGWTLFQTRSKGLSGSGDSDEQKKQFHGSNSVFLFRKVDSNRVRSRNGEGRIRELRLPALDFKNVPLRILQYIILMTDDIFFLA